MAAIEHPRTAGTCTSGARFRRSLALEQPLQIVGVFDAQTAILARHCGFRAIYLPSARTVSFPGIAWQHSRSSLEDAVIETRRIAREVDLPLLAELDPSWGRHSIPRAVRLLARAGAAAVHLDDRMPANRVARGTVSSPFSVDEMCDRIRMAVAAKRYADFVVMVRTACSDTNSLDAALRRIREYVAAGAEMLFADGLGSLDQCRRVASSVAIPVLVGGENECDPAHTPGELHAAGIAMVLYPWSPSFAAAAAVVDVLASIRRNAHGSPIGPRRRIRVFSETTAL